MKWVLVKLSCCHTLSTLFQRWSSNICIVRKKSGDSMDFPPDAPVIRGPSDDCASVPLLCLSRGSLPSTVRASPRSARARSPLNVSMP